MHTPSRSILVGLAAGISIAAPSPALASTTRPDYAVGAFHRSLLGVSVFKQTDTAIDVRGRYGFLRANAAYFTVAYANTVCDPAQAFPVGPFTTNRRGVGSLDTTVTGPAGLVAGTRSISVRRGDDATDIDQDGKTGPTDVVAVAGQPSIGLIECDSRPARF